MSLSPLNTGGYISCIKIFGQPILSPLMTEERRKEVNEDKARAVLIEQRICKKRNSVDSGVMTGSYIDNVKSQNNESESVHSKCGTECSGIKITAMKDFLNNNYTHSENGNLSDNSYYNSSDNYNFKPFLPMNSILNTGNEASIGNKDQATDKICQKKEEDKILNSYENLCDHLRDDEKTVNVEAASLNEITLACDTIAPSNTKDLDKCQVKQAECLDKESNDLLVLNSCQNPELIPSECYIKTGNDICQLSENGNNLESSTINSEEKTDPQTPKNMIRRNSYTLESPSPVLLEHLLLQEKQKTFIIGSNNNNNNNNGNVNPNEIKNLNSSSSPSIGNMYPSFKSVRSSEKKRRVWNKAEAKAYWTNHLNSQDIRLTKSVTSIPASSHMSPLNFRFHSLSLESLTITSNISECVEDCYRRHSSVSCESEPIPVSQIRSLSEESCNKINSTDLKNRVNSGLKYNQRVITNKLCQSESHTDNKTKSDVSLPKNEKPLISNLLELKNGNECNSHFTEKAVLAHNHLLTVRDNQFSSAIIHQDSIYPHKCNTDHSEDSVSFGSTSSLNQQDNVHQQQEILSSEEQSCLLALKLHHDQQIKKLLRRQQEEVKRLSVKCNSLCSPSKNSGSFADSVSDSNVINLSSSQSDHTCCTEMSLDISGKSERRFCNRELFPKPSGYSEKEIRAATVLNAYVRGFLTRRLLRTERVCQIIETIRESLVCALEMRNEQQLELKDLQLHDRLIQQLTHGCNELHNIFSLPAAERVAIIAADREKERRKLTSHFKPPTVSTATRRSMLRKQNTMSLQNISSTKISENRRKIRSRTSSSGATSDSSVCSSKSRVSMASPCLSKKPWR